MTSTYSYSSRKTRRGWRTATGLAAALLAAMLTGFTGASPAQAATTGDLASLALANVGKMACTTNSLGGVAYGSSCTGAGGQPEFWCADFAKWVWANEGVANTTQLSAAAHSFYTYGTNNGTFSTGTPQVGDAAMFSNDGTSAAIHHVAIVSKVNADGSVETVSGDWNGQTGGSDVLFASTSHVVHNVPAYAGHPGFVSTMGMYLYGFVSPVGVSAAQPAVAGGAAAVFTGSQYHVYGIAGSNGTLYEDTFTTAWSGWRGLGGVVTGTPAVTYHDNRFDAFAMSPAGIVYQKTWQGAWGDWHSLGGTFAGGVAADYHDNQYDVFAISTGKILYQNSYVAGAWTGWHALGGTVVGTPAVTYHDGRYDVYAMSPAGIVYQKTWQAGAWSDFRPLGGTFAGGVAAVYHNNQYDVFAISPGKILYQNSYVSGAWTGWHSLGGTVTGTPGVTYHDNRYDVWALSPNGSIYQKTWTGTWDNWHSIAGNFN